MRPVVTRLLFALGVLSLLGPCAVALWLECASGAVHALPDGDEAVVETRLLTMAKALPLLGPYSRFGWSHPGPILFYVLAPSYFLFEKSSVALAVTAAVVNLSALGASVWLLCKATAGTWQRVAVLLFLAVLLHYFGAVFLPTSYTTVWNPVVTVLPYGLFLLVCAALAEGRIEYLPAAVILHAFIAQSHVAYALSGTVALSVAVALAVLKRRRAGADLGDGRARRWWAAGGIALAVLWAPTAVDALFGQGNLQGILRFFAARRHVFTVQPRGAIRLAVWRAAAPWRALWGDPTPDRSSEAGLLAEGFYVVAFASLLLGAARARARGRGYLAALCLVLWVQLIVAALSMLRVDAPDQPYLTWWLAVLGTWTCIAVAGSVLPSTPRAADLPRAQMVVVAAAVAASMALGWRSVRWLHAEYYAFAARVEADRGPTIALAKDLEPILRCAPSVGIVLRRQELWGTVAGVMLTVEKAGLWPVLEPKWRFMFGPGYAYEDDPSPALAFDDRLAHDSRLLRAAPAARVYAQERERDPEPTQPVVRPIQVVSAVAARGDVGRVVDGSPPADGAHWDAVGSVLFDAVGSSITLALPRRALTELIVSADGNDSYRVEGSTDGLHFVPAGMVDNPHLFGLRTRRVTFQHPRPWSFLRIGPAEGDGLYSVRQVTALLGDWALEPTESAAGGPEGAAPSFAFALPAAPVEGLRLPEEDQSAYEIQGSLDGELYVPLGGMGAGHEAGRGHRRFYFNDGELWRSLRLVRATGSENLAPEAMPIVSSPGEVVDVGAPAARHHLVGSWSGDERNGGASWVWATATSAQIVMNAPAGPGWELALAMAPAPPDTEPQSAEVYWEGRRVGQFVLERGVHTYRAWLPPTVEAGDRLVELRFARASSLKRLERSADDRTLAAAVYTVALRPAAETLRGCASGRDEGALGRR